MRRSDWASFLRELNDELFADAEVCEYLPPDLFEANWLGRPGATDDELAVMHARLGVDLPGSYRDFLSTSNGWHTIGWNSIRLWSTVEVGWLRDLDPKLIEIWTSFEASPISDEVYFIYGEAQLPYNIRNEYLRDMLVISSRDWANTDQLWLNPLVRTEDGEWEAWHFSSESPGAVRCRSFGELMERKLRELHFWRDA